MAVNPCSFTYAVKKPWVRTVEEMFRRPMSIQMGEKKPWGDTTCPYPTSVPRFEILTDKSEKAACFQNQLKPFITALPPFSSLTWKGKVVISRTQPGERLLLQEWQQSRTFSPPFFFLFQEKQYLTSAERFEEWNLSGKASRSQLPPTPTTNFKSEYRSR